MPITAIRRHTYRALDAVTRRISPARTPNVPDLAAYEIVRRFRGRKLRLLVRHGTNDLDLLDLILREDSEYALPPQVQPRTILDAGANIGITAVYFNVVYPEARVYCFEPLPANLELLRENAVRNSDRIHVIPRGLSDRKGTFEYHMSDNPRSFGGGTFCGIGHDRRNRIELPVGTVADVLTELKLDRVDLFKLDTEGSEMAILRGTPAPVLAQAQAVIGELHGVDDWQVCQLLSESHALAVNKRFDRGCFPFMAVRRDLVSGVRRAA